MSVDKYKIDSHKLIYHVPRLHEWLKGKTIYPIYVEISPSGTCNHRCRFCALDFMEYQKRFLDTVKLKERLTEMGYLGIKSVMFAGEGEPLLHDQIGEIIAHTKNAGIDVAITTNGVNFKGHVAEKILENVEWLKVSFNGGTPRTYAQIHRGRPSDFDIVLENLSKAVKKKHENGSNCTLGMQMLLLPENAHEARQLAVICKNIGLDYLVIKPYSHHPLSRTTSYKSIDYDQYLNLSDDLKTVNTDEFKVIFRINAMQKTSSAKRRFRHCLALPFWTYIDAEGYLWGCSNFLGDENFRLGSIYESSFEEIWLGPKRQLLLGWVENQLDICKCRTNCRMDEVNSYLWDLKNPPAHVNFI
jgi:radical SAM protein with 4Fe4S-binding SPASM domain